MAEITNHRTGASYLGVNLEILRKEPQDGFINRNCVGMNSEMGLLWTEVSFWVGQQPMFSQEVLLHSSSIRSFTQEIEDSIKVKTIGEEDRLDNHILFGIESPELIVKVMQTIYKRTPDDPPEMEPINACYSILFVVDTGIECGEPGVSGEGPAMYFVPKEEDLLTFSHNWRSEMEMALLLEKQDHESDTPWLFY